MAAAKPLPEAILDARIDVLKLQSQAQRANKPDTVAALALASESLLQAEQTLKA